MEAVRAYFYGHFYFIALVPVTEYACSGINSIICCIIFVPGAAARQFTVGLKKCQGRESIKSVFISH